MILVKLKKLTLIDLPIALDVLAKYFFLYELKSLMMPGQNS